MSQIKEKLYSEIKGTYAFAKAKDYLGNWHYLAAENEEQIEKYCEEYSPRGMYPHAVSYTHLTLPTKRIV